MTRITVVLKTNEGGIWALPQLRELQRRGAQVTVVIPPGDGKLRRALDSGGYRVIPAPFNFSFRPSFRLIRGLMAMRHLFRENQPDIIFYHLYASALTSRLASIGLGARRVHMVAGPLYLESSRIRLAERLLCRLDDHIIAGSEYTAKKYRELGMPDKRVTAIPYGVDIAKFSKFPDQRHELFGVGDKTFVVIMVAYVYAPKSSVFPGVGIKGHDTLLRAWADFVAAHPDSRLVLVGSGFDVDGETHRQSLLRRYVNKEASTIAWFESVEDVRPLYASADISVSPSLSENHGAALEASAMGIPSIVSDAGALPETVTPDSGWVVRAGDAESLLRALTAAHEEFEKGSLTQRGTAARKYCVENFSHDRVVPNVAETVLREQPSRGLVLAICEQRAWRSEDDGNVHGLKTLAIVEDLAQRIDVRLAVRIQGPAGLPGRPLARGATIIPLAWPRGFLSLPMALLRLLTTLWREVGAADVVYADVPGVVAGVGTLIAALRRRPLAVNVVGDANESVSPRVLEGIKGHVAHAIFPRLQRWACRRAVVSNYVTRRVLQERYPPRSGSQTFASSTAIPLGPARRRPYPTGTSRALVTVASLDQNYKGIGDLLEAMAEPELVGLGLHLTVVGSGRLRPHYVKQAADRNVNVTFLEHQSPQDLHAELGRHDAFVLASWTEGLPRALMEAMADGMPAVATRVGGVPELLEPTRITPPHAPFELALKIAELFKDQEAWEASTDLNEAMSRQHMAECRASLSLFVAAIQTLAQTQRSTRGRR